VVADLGVVTIRYQYRWLFALCNEYNKMEFFANDSDYLNLGYPMAPAGPKMPNPAKPELKLEYLCSASTRLPFDRLRPRASRGELAAGRRIDYICHPLSKILCK
jgi:hypothetical protein